MIWVPERVVAGVTVFLLVLGCLVAGGPAEARELEVLVSFDGIAPGQPVMGAGTVHPLLTIGDSDGNDVVAIEQGVFPVAYGATFMGGDVVNGYIGTAQSARGFADLGSGDFTYSTKKHRYVFTFAPGVTVSRFSVRMRDWGDFLPYGANADGHYAMLMTAFNADGGIVATDEIAFTSSDSGSIRNSDEYGNLRLSGDASAEEGKPGNVVLRVTAPGIVRVEVHARDQQSIDPHIGFNELQFAIELSDQDEDGVTDADDQCPDSVTAADSANIVVGPHTTSVTNADDVTGPGCSIQDLVNEVAVNAPNHGQFVVGIDALAKWLVSVGAATPTQARELHQAAAHKHATR